HHVRGAFPFAGGSGLACRSCAPVSFLAAGRRKRTGPCEPVHLIAFAKRIPSVRPCVQSPMPFGFASPLGHVSQGTSRVVGLGDVSRHFCRTVPKPFPSVWEAFGTAFMMRSGLTSGPHHFSVTLLVALPLA